MNAKSMKYHKMQQSKFSLTVTGTDVTPEYIVLKMLTVSWIKMSVYAATIENKRCLIIDHVVSMPFKSLI